METKRQQPVLEGKIEAIPGERRVLLVAPHGFMGNGSPGYKADDERAGELARKMAREFEFYAVINEKYKRVEDLKDANKDKGLINCGRIDQAELIADEFLAPILNFKAQILTEHGDPLVVFIHGIHANSTDAYIKSFKANREIAILIGYGQNNGREGRTATPELVEAFKKAVSEKGNPKRVAVEADPRSKYCGGHKNTLTQLFRQQDYGDQRVQALQLEIRQFFRMPEAIDETVQAIGTSLLELIEVNKFVVVENAPDQSLVDRAHNRLLGIFSGHFEEAMREAGQYLINEFYGGDFDRARNNKPVKGQSLNQLIARLNRQDNGGPSKSWIYNAVNLVVQNFDFQSFQTYGNLGLSQKVELLRVGDPNEKKRLIEETVKNNSTVRQLKEKISELKHRNQSHLPAPKTLARVIDKPDALFTDEYKPFVTEGSLTQYDQTDLDDLLARAQRKRSDIDADIKSLTEYAQNYDRLIETIGAVRERKLKELDAKAAPSPIREVAPWLEQEPRIISVSCRTDIPAAPQIEKRAFTYEGKTGIAETKGFQKKRLSDFACNIGNVCEFGCTFCYVPAITTKQKYVQEILKKGFSLDQVSLYRTKDNLLKCVERDLKKHKKGDGDKRVVFFCTTCDPCPTEEYASITIEAIKLIMENSDLHVRVLSKSKLIVEVAKALDNWIERIIYGVSTGTCRPEISACIEGNATPVEERIKALRYLQALRCRTYGMLCPILPSETEYLGHLIDAINPEVCEHIWAEPINLRGKSLVKTYDQLKQCGLEKDAEELNAVVGNKERWRSYSKELFTTLRHELEKRKVADKLRFLQYVKGEPEEFGQFFESQQGALCL